jgi:hypothetical protein
VADQDVKRVVARAVTDKAFFEALLENPDQALARADFSLSKDELQKLKYGLKNPQTVTVDIVKFIGALHATNEQLYQFIPVW